MFNQLQKLNTLIENITEWTGRLISWLVVFMVLVMFSIVVLRYAFNTGWIAVQESVIYAHVLVFMLGAAFALKREQHVRVDVFYQRFSDKGRAWVNLLGAVLLLLPVAWFIFSSSYEYVLDSVELRETSREAGGLPFVYFLKLQILVMAILLIAQGVSEFLKSLFIIVGIKQERHNA